jgi:hypothetical protein
MPRETAQNRDIGGSVRSRRQAEEDQRPDRAIARLAESQYGVIGRWQLTALGLGEDAIDYRLAVGRPWIVMPRIYAVGQRRLPPLGRSMAAVLSSGPGAVLSHRSAAALWGIRASVAGAIQVTVPSKSRSTKLVRRHHVVLPNDEVTVYEGIPVTTVPRDQAGRISAALRSAVVAGSGRALSGTTRNRASTGRPCSSRSFARRSCSKSARDEVPPLPPSPSAGAPASQRLDHGG